MVIVSLISAAAEVNFDSKTNIGGCCHAMSCWLQVFNVTFIALLMKQGDFLVKK